MDRVWIADDISDDGERVSPLNKDFGFYAHLSIYEFAIGYCQDAVVLDVGSGSGYGSAHLADHGARQVYGIDASSKAAAFSRDYFHRPNLEYMEMRADAISGFSPHSFDVIFTSNVLEHVPDVNCFFRSAAQLLKPSGTLIVAVPPIVNAELQYQNLINPYHVNIWSPRQWAYVIGLYFKDIQFISHRVGERLGPNFRAEDWRPDYNEKDFAFPPETLDDMYRICPITAMFVARNAYEKRRRQQSNDQVKFIDNSFTRNAGYIDPKIRWRLSKYFPPAQPSEAYTPGITDLVQKAFDVARTDGPAAMLKETSHFIKYTLRRKN